MIRPAALSDIPWLIEAGTLAQSEAPNYAGLSADLSVQYKTLVRVILQRALVCINVVDDGTGFVCGALEPAVWFQGMYAVQNLLWVHPDRRGSSRAWRLVQSFEEWAKERGVIRIYSGVSSGVTEERTSRFYLKMGYRAAGPTFVKEVGNG